DFRGRVLVLPAEDEVAIEGLLALVNLPLAERLQIGLPADDVLGEDEGEVPLVVLDGALPDERCEHGDVAEDGDLLLAPPDDVADETADDDGLLTLHDELRRRRALRDIERSGRPADVRADLADLLGDVAADLLRAVEV